MRPSLPIILMSGRPQGDHAHVFLSKPFTRQKLLACIARATVAEVGPQTYHAVPP